jgi:hypothetical protein
MALFSFHIRQMIKELTNRDSRAPHYLLHSVHRMTNELAKSFFEKKLNIRVESEMLNLLKEYFPSNGLIDMKRLMYTTMNLEDSTSMNHTNHSLINGAAVHVDYLPESLKRTKYTPKQIEEMLFSKISERLKNNHPFSYLHRMFQDSVEVSSELVGKEKIRSVMQKFDIIVSDEDFENFIRSHSRSDGKDRNPTLCACDNGAF